MSHCAYSPSRVECIPFRLCILIRLFFLFSFSFYGLGWYNPWPIGQGTCDAFGMNGQHTDVGWKKVFPVAGAGRGHSSTILGPRTLRGIPRGNPPLLRQPHPSFRSRSLLSACVFSSESITNSLPYRFLTLQTSQQNTMAPRRARAHGGKASACGGRATAATRGRAQEGIRKNTRNRQAPTHYGQPSEGTTQSPRTQTTIDTNDTPGSSEEDERSTPRYSHSP